MFKLFYQLKSCTKGLQNTNPFAANRLVITLLLGMQLTACGGGSGGGDDIIPSLDDPTENTTPPPAEEQRPVDEVTPPNNSKILTGDQIGTGSYAPQDLRREVTFETLGPDHPDYPGTNVAPEPGLEVVNVYLLRTRPDSTGLEMLVGTIRNTASFIRCGISFQFVQFLDVNGDDVRESFRGVDEDNFSTGPVRTGGGGGLASQCLDPGESAYFATPDLGIDDPDFVDSVRLAFTEIWTSGLSAPTASVMPISYSAVQNDTFPFTDVDLTVKNVGPTTVQIRAATLIAIDDNGIPLAVLREGPITGSSGEPRLIKPEEVTIVEFDLPYTGMATIVHASVDFDDCGDCNE